MQIAAESAQPPMQRMVRTSAAPIPLTAPAHFLSNGRCCPSTTLNVPFLSSTVSSNNYFAATFGLSLTGPWTLTATDAACSVWVQSNAIPNPEVIPLVNNLQVTGAHLTPHITWPLLISLGWT